MVDNKTVVLWDFDGVIMNSMHIRDLGFVKVLAEFPQPQVDQLMRYHGNNGGLSRFNKFRYFFETVRGEEVSNETIDVYAAKFSEIMLELLIDKKLLINETNLFIKNEYQNFKMHIVSGSAEVELKLICDKLNLTRYFKSIHGSPTHKNELVKQVIRENEYEKESCVLIGDSINDYNAAVINDIDFMGYGEDMGLMNKTTYKLFD